MLLNCTYLLSIVIRYLVNRARGSEPNVYSNADKTELTLLAAASAATAGWRRGVVVSGVRRMNEVNAHRARLVLGWVTTVFGRVYNISM